MMLPSLTALLRAFPALTLGLFVQAGPIQTPASTDDWNQVKAALDSADSSLALDCPAGHCGSPTSAIHLRRLSDSARARDLLLQYVGKQLPSTAGETRVRLTYRLGQAYYRTEEYDLARAAFEGCVSDPISDKVYLEKGISLHSICAAARQAAQEAANIAVVKETNGSKGTTTGITTAPQQ